MIRNNVRFYNVTNGFSTFWATGKEITLANGNSYAIVNNRVFLIHSTDTDTSYSFVKIGNK